RLGVWSSGMILALAEWMQLYSVKFTKHARGPGFNSQLAPFFLLSVPLRELF
ncbi:hypothetical protein HYPBUDRAFT_109150, partial [Hyphopichia burtonii NRRL Y-1933]